MLYDYFEHISFANVWVLPFLILLPVIVWLRLYHVWKAEVLVYAFNRRRIAI
jgi:hypothetical protein